MTKFLSHRAVSFRAQRGAALLLALILLSLIMMVGVASLQQSRMQSKIVANTNAASIAFHAADTAIESVMRNPDDVLLGLNGQDFVESCVAERLESGCAPLSGQGQVQASSMTRRAENMPDRPITGNSTNTNAWRFYEVIGKGSVGVDAFAEVDNTQEFARAEIALNGDIYDEKGRE